MKSLFGTIAVAALAASPLPAAAQQVEMLEAQYADACGTPDPATAAICTMIKVNLELAKRQIAKNEAEAAGGDDASGRDDSDANAATVQAYRQMLNQMNTSQASTRTSNGRASSGRSTSGSGASGGNWSNELGCSGC